MTEFGAKNPSIPVSKPVLDATKAVRAALVVGLVPLGLLISAFADGSVTWDEVSEVVATLLAVPAAYAATYAAENKPKHRI